MIQSAYYEPCLVGAGRKARMAMIPTGDKALRYLPLNCSNVLRSPKKAGISAELLMDLREKGIIIRKDNVDKLDTFELRQLTMDTDWTSTGALGLKTRRKTPSDIFQAIAGRLCPGSHESKYGDFHDSVLIAVSALMAGDADEWNGIKKGLDERSIKIDLSGAIFPVTDPSVRGVIRDSFLGAVFGTSAGLLCVKVGGDSPWGILMLGALGTFAGGIQQLRLATDFTGVNLRDVDLTKAKLRFLDLRGADLTGATTYGTSFRWSVLDTPEKARKGP